MGLSVGYRSLVYGKHQAAAVIGCLCHVTITEEEKAIAIGIFSFGKPLKIQFLGPVVGTGGEEV